MESDKSLIGIKLFCQRKRR